MSTELKDFRGKITNETDWWLEALSQTTGRDRQEIVREVLHREALQYLSGLSIVQRLAERDGMTGVYKGISGREGISLIDSRKDPDATQPMKRERS